MKKLFLVIFCTVIIGVFVGFNYLLWEREDNVNKINGLETSNAADDANIASLTRQVKELEEDNDALLDKVSEDEKQYNLLQEQNRSLQEKLDQSGNQMKAMGDTIYALKMHVDAGNIEEPVRKWIDMLNKGDYEAAYKIYGKDLNNPEIAIGLDAFRSYFKDVVKSIKIKSAKLYTGDENSTDKDKIIVATVLDVRYSDNAGDDKTVFSAGINERYFTMAYDVENKTWVISAFSKYP